jgi:uncharacterized protein YkwD
VASKLKLIAPVVAAVCLAAPAGAAACTGVDSVPTAGTIGKARASTLCLLNAQRRAHHLRRLRLNRKLTAAANAHAADMVSRNYFSHTAPTGLTFVNRILQTGYASGAHWTVGEDLAAGGTPREIVAAWMGSSIHRREILRRSFREVGIGIALGLPDAQPGEVGATYAVDFGRRT